MSVALACLVVAAVAQLAKPAEFNARWAEARIEVGSQTLRPLRVLEKFASERGAGNRRFKVLGTSVQEIDPITQATRWAATTDDESQVLWLDATDTVCYLLAANTPHDTVGAWPRATIRRLDLQTHKWLSPLTLPATKLPIDNASREDDVVGQVLATESATFVLVFSVIRLNKPHAQPDVDGYRVCCFTPGSNEPKWTKEFSWQGNKLDFPYRVFTSLRAGSRLNSIQHLSILRDDILLVCAGKTQELVSLEIDTGELRWRLPRVWEFERGFIGPSVCEHYIDRLGIDYIVTQEAEAIPEEDESPQEQEATRDRAAKAKAIVDAARKAFDEQFEGSIVAGPIMPREQRGFYVAVARGRKGPWAKVNSDCIVYQVSDEGEVEAAANLPSMVEGWPQRATASGAVWTCGRGSLVHLGHAEPDFRHSFHNTEDRLCRVAWYREFDFERDATWLSSDAQPTAAAFNDKILIRTLDGGFVRKKDEKLFEFPINVVRLSNGSRIDFRVCVPFEGEVPWPETGYSKFGDVSVHAHGPYFQFINGFDIDERRVRVEFRRDGVGSTGLDFDLSAIVKISSN